MASVQGGSVVKSVTYTELTAAEQAAARKALAGLGVDDLLTGNGADTFAGGIAQPGSFVAAFASDTVGGGNVFVSGSDLGVSPSSDPFDFTGQTAMGIVVDTSAAVSGHVVTFSDQSTIHLVGVNNSGSGNQ